MILRLSWEQMEIKLPIPSQSELISYLSDRGEEYHNRRGTKLSVGVEHEFFLFRSNNRLATWADSQRFFQEFGNLGWLPCKSNENDDIIELSRQTSSTKFTKVKYEYAPHLIEVAFTYFNELNELEELVASVWDQIMVASKRSGTIVVSKPFLSDDEISQIIDSPERHEINYSRKMASKNFGIAVAEKMLKFPSYTASTQVHIGGLNWWKRPEILAELYELESELFLYSSLLIAGPEEALEIYNRRLNLYRLVFPEFPLIGFPDLKEWNLELWLQELLKSPMLGGSDCKTAGSSIMLSRNTHNAESVFSLCRDLQYIRPRNIGTIEFRGDPAQNDVSSIMALAALRLGMAMEVEDSSTNIRNSYQSTREAWINNNGIFSKKTFSKKFDSLKLTLEKQCPSKGRHLVSAYK